MTKINDIFNPQVQFKKLKLSFKIYFKMKEELVGM